MRVLVDTNVLISAVLFPNSLPARAVLQIAKEEQFYLTAQTIQEFRRFVTEKKPALEVQGAAFLEGINYTLLPMLHKTETLIRDKTDQPILNSAIATNLDFIVTGDKDFLELSLKHPKCVTPREYIIFSFLHHYRTLIEQLTKQVLNNLSA